MEVKDINNKTALAMLARNSAAAIGGGMIGDAFSSLLETQTQAPDFSKDVKFAAKDGAKPENVAKPEESAKKDPVKTDKAKEDNSVREDKDSGRTEDKSASRADEKQKADKKEDRPSDEADSAEEENGDNRVSEATILPDLSLLFAGTVQPVAEVSGEVMIPETVVVSEAPVVTAEAPAMQTEAVQTAVPAAQTAENAVKQNNAGEIDISALQMVPEETVIEAAPVIFEDVKAKTSGKIQLANAGVGQQAVAEDVPAKESVSVENIRFGDKEVKLDVAIEDDGADFSYRKTSDLSTMNAEVENIAADETVELSKSFVQASENAKSRPLFSGSEQQAQVQPQNAQPQNISAAPAVNVQIVNNADVAVDVAKEAVTEVKGMQMAQAAGGSEFVNAARARTAEQLKSPVNDAYKGMSREVAEQVKVNITKSAVKGVDKIDISLKPEELGHIEIKMHLAKNGKLQAEIVASRPETMEILQKEAQNLQKSFEDAGFQTDDNSLSFSCRDDNAQSGRQEQNYEMRRFIGEALDNEFSNDNLSGYAESGWDGQSGLNIRV